MFKFIIISDLHLDNHNVFGELDENGINQRLKDGLNAVEKVLKYAKDKAIKHVFFLGDLFETKRKIATDVLSLTLQTFRKFKKNGIKLYMLLGNHDKFFYNDKMAIHSLESFRDIATIIDTPTRMQLKGIDVVWLPFSDYKQGMLNALYNIIDNCDNAVKLLMLHDDLGGIKYDNGFVSSSPLRYSQLSPKDFNYIFSGHIHKHTVFRNFVYVGSLYQKDFNEEGDTKGLIEVTVNKANEVKWKQVPITSKKFKTVNSFDLKKLNFNYYYYRFKVKEAEVDNLRQLIPEKYQIGRDFILEVEGVSDKIEHVDNIQNNFNLRDITKQFISDNDIIYRQQKLDKSLIMHILDKIGAL